MKSNTYPSFEKFLDRPLRIVVAQVFTSDSAISMLNRIPRSEAPDIILLPEHSFSAAHFTDLLSASSELSKTAIITSIILQDPKGINPPRNRAIRCLGGVGHPIYNKMMPDSLDTYKGDTEEANMAAFRNQPKRCFVSICNDKSNAKQIDQLPQIWLITAHDNTSQTAIVPPIGFTGYIFFSNGSQQAARPSYHQHIISPYSPTSGNMLVDREIPKGVEDMIEVTVP